MFTRWRIHSLDDDACPHSFKTHRARVGGPVGVVGGGDEDGTARPRVGDLVFVARGERRGVEESTGHAGHLGGIPRTQSRPGEFGRAFKRAAQLDHLPHLPPG